MRLILTLLILTLGAQAKSPLGELFDNYCISCHGPEKQKGKVRLDNSDLSKNRQLVESLIAVLEEKEMPPRKKKQPEEVLINQAIDELKGLTKKHKTTSLLKRLTREEYTNSINDTLKTSFDLSEFLPEDHTEHGFNKMGEEQVMSPHQLETYLNTARFIATNTLLEKQPKERSWTFTTKNFHGTKRGDYRTEDGFVLTTNYPWRSNLHFSSSTKSYSRFKIPTFGKYRFDLDLEILNSKDDQTLGVNLGDPRYPTNFKKIKRIFIPAGTKNISLDLTLQKGDQVSFTFDSAKIWRIDGKAKVYKGPKIFFTQAKVRGPIYENWPTYAQRLIMTDSSQNPRALADHLVKLLIHTKLPKDAQKALYQFADNLPKDKQFKIKNAQALLTAVLVSPQFIYKQEKEMLDDKQFAKRLAFFLWNSAPDEELLNAAEKGLLQSKKDISQQALRMINDAKINRFSSDFTKQWLMTDKIDDISPDERLFPEVYPLQIDAMSKEAKAFFDELLHKNLSMTNFIDSDFIMVNDELAKFYGLDEVRGNKFQKVILPENNERGGLLGQAGFLKLTSNTFDTSPILRGVWIIKNIYGEKMEPPVGIEISEPDIRGAKTIKEIMKKHQSTENCYRCHAKIDPLGLALEHYDPLGRYREQYNKVEVISKEKIKIEKLPIEAQAEMTDGRHVKSLSTLKKAMMSDKEKIIKGILGKLLSYSTGRDISIAERAYLNDIYQDISKEKFALKSAILAMIQHEKFREK